MRLPIVPLFAFLGLALSQSAHAACDANKKAEVCGQISEAKIKAMSNNDLTMLRFHKKDCGCPAPNPYASDWGSYDSPRDASDKAPALQNDDSSSDALRAADKAVKDQLAQDRAERAKHPRRSSKRQIEQQWNEAFGAGEPAKTIASASGAAIKGSAKSGMEGVSAREEALAALLAKGQCPSNNWRDDLGPMKAMVSGLLKRRGVSRLREQVRTLSQGERELTGTPANQRIFKGEDDGGREFRVMEKGTPRLALYMAAGPAEVYFQCLDINSDTDKVRKAQVAKQQREQLEASDRNRAESRLKSRCEALCNHYKAGQCFVPSPGGNVGNCQSLSQQLAAKECLCDVTQAQQTAHCGPSCEMLRKCGDADQRDSMQIMGIVDLDQLCAAAKESVKANACTCK